MRGRLYLLCALALGGAYPHAASAQIAAPPPCGANQYVMMTSSDPIAYSCVALPSCPRGQSPQVVGDGPVYGCAPAPPPPPPVPACPAGQTAVMTSTNPVAYGCSATGIPSCPAGQYVMPMNTNPVTYGCGSPDAPPPLPSCAIGQYLVVTGTDPVLTYGCSSTLPAYNAPPVCAAGEYPAVTGYNPITYACAPLMAKCPAGQYTVVTGVNPISFGCAKCPAAGEAPANANFNPPSYECVP